MAVINPSAAKSYNMKQRERDARNRNKPTKKQQRHNKKAGVNQANLESRERLKKGKPKWLKRLWEK